MSVCFLPFIYDTARGAWTLPGRASQDTDAFTLSLANANAADLLNALGIAPEPAPEPLPIGLMSALVTRALRRRLDKRSVAIAPVIDAQPGTMTLIRCGRRAGYVEERLGDLARLIQRSCAIGATHPGWN